MVASVEYYTQSAHFTQSPGSGATSTSISSGVSVTVDGQRYVVKSSAAQRQPETGSTDTKLDSSRSTRTSGYTAPSFVLAGTVPLATKDLVGHGLPLSGPAPSTSFAMRRFSGGVSDDEGASTTQGELLRVTGDTRYGMIHAGYTAKMAPSPVIDDVLFPESLVGEYQLLVDKQFSDAVLTVKEKRRLQQIMSQVNYIENQSPSVRAAAAQRRERHRLLIDLKAEVKALAADSPANQGSPVRGVSYTKLLNDLLINGFPDEVAGDE